ncbi:MAG: DUF5696 domain-containing protein [Clostridia bacterium]|nr:DUF5696 domain-containing protein [Clostridia bacterium]
MMKAVRNGTRRIAAVLMCLVLVLLLCACGDEAPTAFKKYQKNFKISKLDSGEVISNGRFTLSWDDEHLAVSITDRETGHTWATTPSDYLTQPEKQTMTKSETLLCPISVEYMLDKNNTLSGYSSYKILEDAGRCSVYEKEDGLLIYYFLDEIELIIPVYYRLADDHFSVTVDTYHIYEGKYRIYSVDVAPYMASVANAEKEDPNTYVFVPSGSGALMYTESRGEQPDRYYSETLYGSDFAALQEAVHQTGNATMPVFGVSDGKDALLGIIEEGASCCTIKAGAGSSTGYSNVYASFAMRGHNTERIRNSYGGYRKYSAYSDGYAKTLCTVNYYPVSGENGYSEMAKRYRRYLTEEQGMKADVSTRPLYMQMLGGAQIDRSFLGIPYSSVEAATTVKQAQDIAQLVEKDTGLSPVVQLKGYGASGEDIGKIAGGMTLNSAFGSFKDVEALQKKFKTYFDIDVIRFAKSGAGLSFSSDGAKAENKSMASHYIEYAQAMNNGVEDSGVFHMTARGKLSEITAKAVKKLKGKSVSGISLSTIGQIGYSDYRSPDYYNKCGMDADVSAILKNTRKTVSVMTQNAYSYAAAQADHVICAPIGSSGYTCFDVDVPFYQMVFKGSVSLSGPSITLAGNQRDTFLKTLEGGSGLLFTASDHHNNAFINKQSGFSASVYKDQKATINSFVKEAKPFLEAVADASIDSHCVMAPAITKTAFSNGVVLIVNRGTQDYVSDEYGTVPAGGFIYR